MSSFKRNIKFIICIFIFSLFNLQLFSVSDQALLKLYENKQYKEAITECKSEIQKKEKQKTQPTVDTYVVLCWSLLERHQYHETEYWAIQGQKKYPYDHRLIEILAETYFFLGNNDDSLYFFQQYIGLVANNGTRVSSAYYYMGEIYIREGSFNHADISLTTAVRFEPLKAAWWTRLGYAREMSKHYSTAADAYNTALAINPSEIDAIKGNERVKTHLHIR